MHGLDQASRQAALVPPAHFRVKCAGVHSTYFVALATVLVECWPPCSAWKLQADLMQQVGCHVELLGPRCYMRLVWSHHVQCKLQLTTTRPAAWGSPHVHDPSQFTTTCRQTNQLLVEVCASVSDRAMQEQGLGLCSASR